MNMKELQKKVDAIHQELHALKEKKDNLYKEIEQSGYYVDKQKRVQEKKEVIGLFWDFNYGWEEVEMGMIMSEGSGAVAITDEQFEAIKTYLKEQDYDELEALLNTLTEARNREWDDNFQDGKLKVTEEGIFWETIQDGGQGEMGGSTYFQIKKTCNSIIKSTKITYKENVPYF